MKYGVTLVSPGPAEEQDRIVATFDLEFHTAPVGDRVYFGPVGVGVRRRETCFDAGLPKRWSPDLKLVLELTCPPGSTCPPAEYERLVLAQLEGIGHVSGLRVFNTLARY